MELDSVHYQPPATQGTEHSSGQSCLVVGPVSPYDLAAPVLGPDTTARKDARNIYGQCPHDTIATLGQIAYYATDVNPRAHEAAYYLKPEVYGRVGVIVRDSVRTTLMGRRDSKRGPFGLYGSELGEHTPATKDNVSTWDGLKACWTNTLQADTRHTLKEAHQKRNTALMVLRAVWATHNVVAGVEPEMERTIVSQVCSGTVTAGNSCTNTTYGMNEFLKEQHVTDSEQRAVILARSPGPILKETNLGINQLIVFDAAYMGTPHGGKTDYSHIRTDIYSRHCGSGRVDTTHPLEQLRLPNGRTVGAYRTITPRIGCPVLLTPRLVQGLWCSFVNTAQIAGLI